jgi:hypothetical protein
MDFIERSLGLSPDHAEAGALCAPSMRLRVQYESLSEAYLRLAEQADRNDMT